MEEICNIFYGHFPRFQGKVFAKIEDPNKVEIHIGKAGCFKDDTLCIKDEQSQYYLHTLKELNSQPDPRIIRIEKTLIEVYNLINTIDPSFIRENIDIDYFAKRILEMFGVEFETVIHRYLRWLVPKIIHHYFREEKL